MLLLLSLVAVTLAQRLEVGGSKRQVVRYRERAKVLLFHLHKAGGTTMCQTLKRAGYRSNLVNCVCDDLVDFGKPASALLDKMTDLDVCMIESARSYPTPSQFHRFDWPYALAIVVREPWARLKSAYEREIFIVLKSMPIETFASAAYSSFNTERWGPYNRPNYYVWTLAGRPDAPNYDHLRDATKVLDGFTHVFVLEKDEEEEATSVLANMTLGRAVAFARATSNNPFSPNYKKNHSDLVAHLGPLGKQLYDAGRPETEYFRPTFNRENELDRAFFVRAKKRGRELAAEMRNAEPNNPRMVGVRRAGFMSRRTSRGRFKAQISAA